MSSRGIIADSAGKVRGERSLIFDQRESLLDAQSTRWVKTRATGSGLYLSHQCLKVISQDLTPSLMRPDPVADAGHGPVNITRLRRFAIGVLISIAKARQTIAELLLALTLRPRRVFDLLRMTRNANPYLVMTSE